MQVVSTHSHLLGNAADMDKIAESGMFSQIWLLGLHTGSKIFFNNGCYHPAAEEVRAANYQYRVAGPLHP